MIHKHAGNRGKGMALNASDVGLRPSWSRAVCAPPPGYVWPAA
jgi:hypothetical protein